MQNTCALLLFLFSELFGYAVMDGRLRFFPGFFERFSKIFVRSGVFRFQAGRFVKVGYGSLDVSGVQAQFIRP